MASSDGPLRPTALSDTLAGTSPRPHGNLTLDDYEIGQVIGTGGMGEVILAHDRRLDRDVAIKRMRDAAPTAEVVERFLREAKIQARLDHPAIVPVHELGQDSEGRPFFTMKKLAGVTLADKLLARGPIQPLLRALVDVSFAIDLAHTRQIVHRDLKPSNIMLGDYGEVYVLDWGIARVLGEPEDGPVSSGADPSTPSTQSGDMLGTPGYMAPEQIRAAHKADKPVDIYALGAILFEILAGEPLHPSIVAVMTTLTRPVDSPRARCPDRNVPPELDRLCVAALADDPSARPTSREFAERLQRYLDGDRDVEQRRKLAADQLDAARSALAGGRRADGIFAAGRALALDPESLAASELVLSSIVEPPQPLPSELVLELERDEDAFRRQRSRRSILPMLGVVLVLPVLIFTPVTNWPELVALFVVAGLLIGLAFVHASYGWVTPRPLYFAINLVFITAFSRLSSPLILTPIVVCGLLVVIGSTSPPTQRPWDVIAFAILSILVPFTLERIGVLSSTMSITADTGVLFVSSIFDNHGAPATRLLGDTVGTVIVTIVVSVYFTVVSRQRQAAQRALHLQTWALQQLLPRRVA